MLIGPLFKKLCAFPSNSIIWSSHYPVYYLRVQSNNSNLIWKVFNLTPDRVSTSMSCIDYIYKKKKIWYNELTKVPHDWLLTACVCERFDRVCAFINRSQSYLMLTWCCALNLIMIITIITNTDNIFQSETETLMNQSKIEYIWGHFHQRLMGRSFCGNLSHCIQFQLVFQTICKVMKSDHYVPTVTSPSTAVAIVMIQDKLLRNLIWPFTRFSHISRPFIAIHITNCWIQK